MQATTCDDVLYCRAVIDVSADVWRANALRVQFVPGPLAWEMVAFGLDIST